MEQREVKINGLKFNHQFGIIQVCELEFDEKVKMYVTKGKAGNGKTSITKGLQLATQGSKTLVDNDLYGKVDLEVQLTDGDVKLWIACKTLNKTLQYTLFVKDENGKKVKNPIIDGNEATPAKYLDALQTELTWKMDELTSENTSIQKKILLKLYQSGLKQIGIIFDKNHPDYKTSILGKIEDAENKRNEIDALRKTKGGIAEDLELKGFFVDRPETCPDYVNIEEIELKIKESEKEKTIGETGSSSVRDKELAEIKSEAQETVNKCLNRNNELKSEYDKLSLAYNVYIGKVNGIKEQISLLSELLDKLGLSESFEALEKLIKWPTKVDEPKETVYILFKNNQLDNTNIESLDSESKELVNKVLSLRQKYIEKNNEPVLFDATKLIETISNLELSKKSAFENNKIVDAIDYFHKWRFANAEVSQLKNEYVKLLAKVDTGVEGLKIVPVDDDIFLMYDGSYDPAYFGNPKKELRKVSSYSGTQKPLICLLIQNYLLSKKPKAMRYMHIDNIPIDLASKLLLEKMSKELNLHIFLNITGDFEKNELLEGEILVEGGEVFF